MLLEAPQNRLYIVYESLKPGCRMLNCCEIHCDVISGKGWRRKENQEGLEGKLWATVLGKEQIWEMADDEFSFSSVEHSTVNAIGSWKWGLNSRAKGKG